MYHNISFFVIFFNIFRIITIGDIMKFAKRLLKISIIIILLIFLIYIGVYVYAKFSDKLPIKTANNFYLYDKDNNLYNTNNEWISLDDISDNVIEATLSIEDKNFYGHHGFDFLRIGKAMLTNITNRKTLQGASTISQQYAKNLFLDFDKTWSRKIEEAFLTMRLESHYSKDEILEGYLNTINYGGIFGIENASKHYFNKSSKELNLAEATILAGIPKSPSNYSPTSNPENSKKRQKLILNSMVKNGYITKKEMKEAYLQELEYVGIEKQENSSTLMYYQDAVMKELETIDSIPKSFLKTGGLKIYTNLDINAQKNLEEKITINMENEDSDLQIASVLMDPDNGKILAIAGGRDYNLSEFNRVTNSKRQVGSTMKPFLYYSALEKGFTPSTTFTSQKTTFTFSENKKYSPENYSSTYANKPISMAAAIAYSDNIYAVKTHLFLGEETLIDTAKKLGITSNLNPIPSLALGTEEINILEMMKGYASFANEGYKVKPHFIQKIEDQNGNVLYEYKEDKESILNKDSVYILNELLANSYAKEFIDYTYPTCIGIAPKMTKKYAIKTGTTNTDHLIFGYNKDALLGIWMGFDDNRESEVKTGNVMKNIWVDIMEDYLEGKKDNWYKTPENVVGVLVDPISGKPAKDSSKAKVFYYKKGSEPGNTSTDLEEVFATMNKEENS